MDVEAAKVTVELPFIRSPVEFLTNQHGGSSNYYQAHRIYKAQCRKPEEVKALIRDTHADLVTKGFMSRLEDLSLDQQQLISNAPFAHYLPWRAVYKPNSTSTPVRLVVDPSCTGLNIILAKGENMLTKIPEILVRLRTHRFAWSTDISKLYNMLHLKDSALPYSLFLFEDSLQDAVPPVVWVMTRAWYGVCSTGNQSGVALEGLAKLMAGEYPAAVDPLSLIHISEPTRPY